MSACRCSRCCGSCWCCCRCSPRRRRCCYCFYPHCGCCCCSRCCCCCCRSVCCCSTPCWHPRCPCRRCCCCCSCCCCLPPAVGAEQARASGARSVDGCKGVDARTRNNAATSRCADASACFLLPRILSDSCGSFRHPRRRPVHLLVSLIRGPIEALASLSFPFTLFKWQSDGRSILL